MYSATAVRKRAEKEAKQRAVAEKKAADAAATADKALTVTLTAVDVVERRGAVDEVMVLGIER